MINWYYLAIISAIFSAAAAITQKKVLFKERVLSFTTALGIFNLILALPFFFLINFSSLPYTGLGVLFIKSLIEAGAFLCVMTAIKNLELSRALPLLVLIPGLVAIFAFIFLGQSLTSIEILGIILLLIGTYILELKEKEKIFSPIKSLIKSKGQRYILFALALMTIKSLLDATILKQFAVPINTFMGFQHLFLAIIFISSIFFLGKNKELKSSFKNSWILILIISIFTIIYRYTEIASIKTTQVALVLAIKRMSVFFAILIGGNLFKEHNLIKRIIATAIMTAGAILVVTG